MSEWDDGECQAEHANPIQQEALEALHSPREHGEISEHASELVVSDHQVERDGHQCSKCNVENGL